MSAFAIVCAVPGARAQASTDAVRQPVKLLAFDTEPDRLRREFYGRVVARETVELSFSVGGELVELAADEGARVARGSMLARLDLAPLERAVRRHELLLEQARRDSERADRLAASNALSRVAAEDAQTAEGLAEVALADAREALADATLEAPFDALVVEQLAPSFANVAPGQPVLRVHDLSEIRVRVEIPERVVARHGDLTDVTFTVGLPGRHADVPVRLAEYRADTGAVAQSYTVELVLPDLDAPAPLPGASARVAIVLDARAGGRPLPASALLAADDGRAEVMVFEPDAADLNTGTVRRTSIGVYTTDGTALYTDDLPAGTEIVAAGVQMLADGQPVRRWTSLVREASR